MGASYHSETYQDCSPDDLKSQVEIECRNAELENGSEGYTGTWAEKRGSGLEFKPKVFACLGDADDYVMEHADKWGALIAVKYMSGITTTSWLVGGWCSE